MILENICAGIVIGVWAWLWCNILTAPGEMLAPIKAKVVSFFFDKEGNYKHDGLPIYKPFIGCPKCHAFWLSIVLWWAAGGIETTIIATGVAAYLSGER